MSRDVITQWGATFYKRVVLEDRELVMSMNEQEALRDAFRRLTANKAQATLLVKGLANIYEERAFVDLWLEAIQDVVTPEWLELLLSKAPKDPDGVPVQYEEKVATVTSRPEQSSVTIEQGIKIHEVKQGGADLVEHALQFEDRMKMLKVPPSKWLGLFEASLNSETRVSFWRAHRSGVGLVQDGLQSLVREMLHNQGLNSLKSARTELDQVRQRKGESAPAFATRLHAAIAKYGYRTGRIVSGEEYLELLLTRLYDGQRIEALLADRYTEADVLKLAAVFESGHGHDPRKSEERRPKTSNSGDKSLPAVPAKSEEVKRKYQDKLKQPPRVRAQQSVGVTCSHCGRGHSVCECWTLHPEKRPLRNRAQALAGRTVHGRVGGTDAVILLDSCADVSVAKKKAVDSTWIRNNQRISFRWGKTEVDSDEAYLVRVVVDGVSSLEEIYVVEDTYLGEADVLLSSSAAERLGWTMRRDTYDKNLKEDVDIGIDLDDSPQFSEFVIACGDRRVVRAAANLPVARTMADLKEPARVDPVEFSWDEDGLKKASFNLPMRRYKPDAERHLRERAAEMVDAGVADYGDSVYASPWLTVAKPKGGWRETVDMRLLNVFMKLSQFPCTTTKDVLRKLTNPRWRIFSELDLKIAFW